MPGDEDVVLEHAPRHGGIASVLQLQMVDAPIVEPHHQVGLALPDRRELNVERLHSATPGEQKQEPLRLPMEKPLGVWS